MTCVRSWTTAVIDAQTVRGADTVAAASDGYDAGKKTKGRKRNIATDCLGLLLAVTVTAAGMEDRDSAHRLLALLRERFSTISLVWADGGCAGRLVIWAKAVLHLTHHRQTYRRHQGLRGAAPKVGRRTHIGLADPPPTPGPRLRTPTGPSRSHGLVGHRHHHDPTPHPRTRRQPTPTTLGPTQTTQPNHSMIIYQQALRRPTRDVSNPPLGATS
jgi:hypothetical protein